MAQPDPVLLHALIGGATAFALALLLRTVRPTAANVDGQYVVAYGRVMKGLVIVFSVFWVILCVAAIFAPAQDRVVAALAVVGFLLLVGWLHLEFFGVQVTLNESGVHTRSPWRSTRLIPWSAFKSVWYSPICQWQVAETDGFGRLRLHDYLSGVDTLLSELEARGVPVARRPAV